MIRTSADARAGEKLESVTHFFADRVSADVKLLEMKYDLLVEQNATLVKMYEKLNAEMRERAIAQQHLIDGVLETVMTVGDKVDALNARLDKYENTGRLINKAKMDVDQLRSELDRLHQQRFNFSFLDT